MAAKKKPFGGLIYDFTKCPHTMKEVFGKGSPSEMVKKLFAHAKKCASKSK